MYTNNVINNISDDIPNGTTKRTDCPNCGGRNTFTITNNMGSLVWNCYKASCNLKGGTRVHLSINDIRDGFVGAKEYAEDFVMPEYVVPYKGQRELTRFTAEYAIDEWELFYDVKDNRAVFPIRHDGVIVDATGRSLSKRLPKWKKYGKSGLPFTAGCGKVAVVVEDCVSATVVGYSSFVGVALLGTSLQESHKGFLSQFSTAVIALDPDALPKTLQMAKELRGHVPDVRVLKLNNDLKYRNPKDMEKLNGIIIN
mgnify:FL=1|tara:strand:- start:1873 stop:2637 length:765 start_codon:yes stop_codon:yes gene_type:complete